MSTYEQFLAIGVAVPLISFVQLAFFGHRIGKPLAGWVATCAIGISCVLSASVLFDWLGMDAAKRAELTANAARFHWADLGSVPLTVGVKLDSLTVAMYFMVSFIAFWIHWFSIGYMAGHSDEVDGVSKYHRFFTYLSLFCVSMLGLVISSSLLFLFIFWELVGLCSYLLIGFYFDKKYASNAAMKAFITNRVGDFGFLAGLMLVLLYLGTFDLDQAAATFDLAAHKAGAALMSEPSAFTRQWLAAAPAETQAYVARCAESGAGMWGSTYTLLGFGLASLMGIGLFCGAMGKSAQVPLQVWLPDAMAGPTPVSALIHAATMVAAGVYLVARIYRLLTPEAQMFIAVIGCVTLTMAALIAIVQTDIKKVLAYSTLSQLGYMVFGMGVGAWTAALFHLITHAFFKALMFLGSGQVIEGCHHEQDIRKMGGLRSKMPVTCWTFLVGVLAIAGFGIPGANLGLGGYFSKDEILVVAHDRAFNWIGGADGHSHEGGHASQLWRRLPAGVPGVPAPSHRLEAGATTTAGAHGVHPQPQFARHGLVAGASFTADEAAGGDHHGNVHDSSTKSAVIRSMPTLPRWMFWLPLIIAYVTPFYMMRCWWLTFMGKPRDHHVHDHAHESPMMYIPLVVLAAGTFVSSYLLFRPLLADIAPVATDAAMVVGLDGHFDAAGHGGAAGNHGQDARATRSAGEPVNLHPAHEFLNAGVGFAWLAGFALAWLIYRGGLGIADGIRRLPLVRQAHAVLENKFYFDALYDNVLVNGTVWIAYACRYLFDAIIDGLVNLSALATERLARFTGRQMDMPLERGDIGLVDAIVNGVATGALRIGDGLRSPQSGRIRNYLMFAAASAAVVLLAVLYGESLAHYVSGLWSTAKPAVAAR